MRDTLQRLFRYKAWANDERLTALAKRGGASPGANMAIKALSHTHVVDRIFAPAELRLGLKHQQLVRITRTGETAPRRRAL